MQLNELILEITRKCNAHCDHCLRGNAQNIDMDDSIIDKALEGVDSIINVVFTGGEPSLAVSRIKYFLEAIKKRNISLDSFYLVTNGKNKSIDLVFALVELYEYCETYYSYDDAEVFGGLVISKDQFHESDIGDISEADKLYRCLSFYRPDDRKTEIKSIISEGRAIEYGIGNRTIEPDRMEFELDDEEEHINNIDSIYINALGDIIPGCDFSFETQEEIKLGNVLSNTIEEILLKEEVSV